MIKGIEGILSTEVEGERSLNVYRRCDFSQVESEFTKMGRGADNYVNKRWKRVIRYLKSLNGYVWELAETRRNIGLDTMNQARLKDTISEMLLITKQLLKEVMTNIGYEEAIWVNSLFSMRREEKMSDREYNELKPTAQLNQSRQMMRQILNPVINHLKVLEGDVINGEVDEDGVRYLETMMLEDVLPTFEDMFKDTIERQKERF